MTLLFVYGLVGALLGFLTPEFSQRIVLYKCEKREIQLAAVWSRPVIYQTLFCAMNAFVWIFATLRMENNVAAFLLSVLFSLALMIAVIDFKIRIIPNELVLAMLFLGLVFQMVMHGLSSLLFSALCMAAMMLVFTIVAVVMGFGKVGAGDVKLAGAMGMALGYPDLVTALVVMSIAFVLFTVLGLKLRMLTLRTMVPFAPFLMCGMMSALLLRVFDPELVFVTALIR